MSHWKRFLLASFAMVGLLFGAILWMAGGLQQPGTSSETFAVPEQSSVLDRLTVLTWNIAWGYGPGSEGTGYEPATRDRIVANLDAIAALIRDSRADVVLLQEVDFDARRSHHIDEAAWIANAAGLPYVARAVSWRANWVPFPYWPPTHHFGDMRSGGAVLSRIPIVRSTVELQPHPAGNPWWYNLFYLFRYSQTIELATTPPSSLINVHFEAWDRQARLAHARRLADTVRAATATVIAFGGDMNTVPPEAQQKHAFPEYPEDDYRDDPTLEVLRTIAGYREVATAVGAPADAPAWRTFPALAPDRRLDYLFVRSDWLVESARVLTEVTVSDHLPVLTRLVHASAVTAPDRSDAP